VGVAMGANGSAMAVKAADVVMMSSNLTKLSSTIVIGKLTRALILENVVFSVVVKIVAIVLAMTGYMLLWHAILIDIGTLLVVIGNGIRPLLYNVYERNERSEAADGRSASLEAIVSKKAAEEEESFVNDIVNLDV
jgi:cation transport ATPase